MTTFEFSIIEGIQGRGGTAIGVKEHYTLRKASEPEPTIEEKPEVNEEPIPSPAEVPAEEPEPQPEPEPELAPAPEPEPVVEVPPEPEPAEEVAPVVEPTEEPIVEEAVEPEAVEPVVEPEVEEEPKEEPPFQTTNIKLNFDPPSPFFGPKVRVNGSVEGLGSEPKYYLSVVRLVEGNGTEPVGEVGLTVDGDRTVAYQIRKIPQVPVLAFPLPSLYRPLEYHALVQC